MTSDALLDAGGGRGRRPLLRSLLFAPASHERHASKALISRADAAILDLEDSVAMDSKSAARAAVEKLLLGRAEQRPLAFVRINGMATPQAYPDLLAVVRPGLDAIVVPKVESAQQVASLGWLLDQLEQERGVTPGSVAILPIVETARGVAAATEIAAASPRVWTLNFGIGDFAVDTGMRPYTGHPGVAVARTLVVLACRVAGVDAPIDTAHLDLDGSESLAAEAEEARRLGFQGKACIHPDQIAVVLRAFSPTPEEVARARCVVEAFDRAVGLGNASIRVGADFVDYPVAERARRLLELAARAEYEDGRP